MLEAIKSFLTGSTGNAERDAIAAWARRSGHRWKREKEGDGFAIDGASPTAPWRIEWGAPQRPYIQGHELRIRMALDLPPDLQMLVMTQSLEEALAKEAFELGTQGNQTLVGATVLEETRWLVMFPKIVFNQSKTLRNHYAGVSSLDYEGGSWLEARLAKALERAAGQWLSASPPFLIMTLRGRLYLRMQLAEPDESDIVAALELFEIAAEEALRVARARGGAPVAWRGSRVASAWQKLPPDTER
jgi:hypothetical protein